MRTPAPGQETLITNQQLARLDAPVAATRQRLEDAQAAAKAIPAKVPLSQHNPDLVRLDTETKLITHAIRMAAYNAETILARALNGAYARADDEAYALIREALTTSGDITPADGTLTIRLDPLSAPRRTRPRRPLQAAHRHRHQLPRHQPHPAVRSQRTHCINDLPMSGALGPVGGAAGGDVERLAPAGRERRRAPAPQMQRRKRAGCSPSRVPKRLHRARPPDLQITRSLFSGGTKRT